jgi:TolB-like protein
MRWHFAVPALALILLLAAVGAWHYRNPLVPAPERTAENRVVDVPKGPAIAVLPFVNMSGDQKQDYFSDGVTEDILTEMSRARDLRVLARNTTFQYKGQAVDVSRLGRDLKVRYVLEGSIQRTGDRLRVSAQLIDTETGSHVWADRYDREMADVFLVQDEIVNQIVAKIAGSYGVIENTEAKSAARKNPEQIQAYDLVLRARDVMQWEWTGETFRTARATLYQAVALDPSNAQARRELAWLAVLGWVFQLDEVHEPSQEIMAQAAKAVQLDPADARARMVAASAYFFTKQLDLFAQEADQALTLAPYDAEILAALACMISSAGDHQRGVALAKKANALNADSASGWYHSTVYTAYYLNGDFEHALEVARQNDQQEMFYSYLEIIPIYGQLGMKQEALVAWRNLHKYFPNPSAETFQNWWRLWNIRDAEVARLMDGVYKSGVLGADAKSGQ